MAETYVREMGLQEKDACLCAAEAEANATASAELVMRIAS